MQCVSICASQPTAPQMYRHMLFMASKTVFIPIADSLMHRAAVAEMLNLLEPQRKSEAIKLIEGSTNGVVPRLVQPPESYYLLFMLHYLYV